MSNKKITVGLLWHSVTSDNLGVGALTISQMALIEEAAKRRGVSCCFVLIGTKGESSYLPQNFEVAGISEFALRAFKAGDFSAFRHLRNCDIVFDIGEGDSFADIYGLKRLFMQVISKSFCKLSGVPLVLSPQTIGPFKSRAGRLFGKLGLHASKAVYARDAMSADYVRSLGFGDKLSEVIDVAFALPFTRPEQGAAMPLKLGINVSGLMLNTANEFGFSLDYRRLVDRTCELMLAIPGAEVYLVPHVICDAAEVEDDYRASQKIAEKYPSVKIAPRFKSPSEAKSFISGLDFLTGARMHACIAAISSGVPVLPMAYSRKFNGLFSSLDYPHVLDCLRMNTEQGLELMEFCLKSLPELKNNSLRGKDIAAAKLEKYVSDVEGFIAA